MGRRERRPQPAGRSRRDRTVLDDLAARQPAIALHVVVAPPDPDPEGAETIRGVVAAALEPLTEDVTVTVDASGKAEPPR